MKALQFTAFGNPLESIEVSDVPSPTIPTGNEIVVSVEYAPINPSELLMIQGLYGVRPQLPAGLGQEGIGRVISVGQNVSTLVVGDRVSLPTDRQCWREQLLLSESEVIRVPSHVDSMQLSMLRANPVTAALLLSEFVSLNPGDWVIQNAGNSGVGRSVIAFAKHRGLRTVSLVRREELVDDLTKSGGDVVLLDGPKIAQRVSMATERSNILLAIDGVAGESMGSLTSCLSPGGTLVAYSGMSGKPGTLSPLHTIFRDINVRGFWLGHSRWANHPKITPALEEAVRLIADGSLNVPIAGVYGLEEYREAISHALAGGKVLFKPN